jgi:hypothetical protein
MSRKPLTYRHSQVGFVGLPYTGPIGWSRELVWHFAPDLAPRTGLVTNLIRFRVGRIWFAPRGFSHWSKVIDCKRDRVPRSRCDSLTFRRDIQAVDQFSNAALYVLEPH